MAHAPAQLTVDRLRELLKGFPGEAKVQFAGGLEFYRLKMRNDDVVQIEFSQNIYQNSKGRWTVDPSSTKR